MEALEEGQIPQDDFYIPVPGYNTAYEWPGDEYDATSSLDLPEPSGSRLSAPLRPAHSILRFVILRSSIFPAKRKVAVVDTYSEVQIGRDVQPEGSATPRIRLKEMEVSKVHATAYWDGARKEWNVVDMGSKHGTFLRPGPVSCDSEDIGTRLSQPRTASIPRRLRHSDQLTLGSTTFEVHIHDNQRPCRQCNITGHEEIPLFPVPKNPAVKRTRDMAGLDPIASGSVATGRDPKKALIMLKRSLLTHHDALEHASTSIVPAERSNEYVDRAARRRLLHPGSRPDTPGVSITPPAVPHRNESPSPTVGEVISKVVHVVSQPPVPLSSANVGHRLLMQQGWSPGSALGAPPDPSDDRIALVDPLEVKPIQNRAGLGMKQVVLQDTDSSISCLNWKEREKFKRFGGLGK